MALPPLSASTWVDAQGRSLQLRPMQQGDAPLLERLWNADLTPAARFNRFLGQPAVLSPKQLAEQMSLAGGVGRTRAWLIVQRQAGEQAERVLAEGRWTPAATRSIGLLAFSVMTHCQGQGLGRSLLQALLRAAAEADLQGLNLHALQANAAVLHLAQGLGFERMPGLPPGPWLCLHYRFQGQPAQRHWPFGALSLNRERLHA